MEGNALRPEVAESRGSQCSPKADNGQMRISAKGCFAAPAPKGSRRPTADSGGLLDSDVWGVCWSTVSKYANFHKRTYLAFFHARQDAIWPYSAWRQRGSTDDLRMNRPG